MESRAETRRGGAEDGHHPDIMGLPVFQSSLRSGEEEEARKTEQGLVTGEIWETPANMQQRTRRRQGSGWPGWPGGNHWICGWGGDPGKSHFRGQKSSCKDLRGKKQRVWGRLPGGRR